MDSKPVDIEPPLGQFQHTVFSKEDVLKLVQDINERVKENGERRLSDRNLTSVFETFWPQLENQLGEIRKRKEAKIVVRPERQVLEEILEILRGQEKRSEEAVPFGLGGMLARETPSIQKIPVTGKDLYVRLISENYERAQREFEKQLKELQQELEKARQRDKKSKSGE